MIYILNFILCPFSHKPPYFYKGSLPKRYRPIKNRFCSSSVQWLYQIYFISTFNRCHLKVWARSQNYPHSMSCYVYQIFSNAYQLFWPSLVLNFLFRHTLPPSYGLLDIVAVLLKILYVHRQTNAVLSCFIIGYQESYLW